MNPAQDSINQSRHNVSTTYLGSRRDALHGKARSSMSLVDLWVAGDTYMDIQKAQVDKLLQKEKSIFAR
jgi:hypothetical protein